jgi:hypothetical protein
MDDFFGQYLLSYRDQKSVSQHDKTRNKCMVIIESRDSFWLPLVIKNAIDKCPDFNLYVFSSDDIIKKLRQSIEGDFVAADISLLQPLRHIKNYNLLLTDEVFWQRFAEEHVVIFQLDCIFLREPKVEEYVHDFLGAVCGAVEEDKFIVNGGLSYRFRPAMTRACLEMKLKGYNREMSEDILFTDVLRKNGGRYRFPTLRHCNEFSIESFGNVSTCIGVHGTDKYYVGKETKNQLVQYQRNIRP